MIQKIRSEFLFHAVFSFHTLFLKLVFSVFQMYVENFQKTIVCHKVQIIKHTTYIHVNTV